MQGALPLPGDSVWIRRRRWRVDRVVRNRHVLCLDVTARERRLTFLSPFDRVTAPAPASRVRHVRVQHAMARLAARLTTRDDLRLPLSAIGARAQILPHQLEPALATLAGHARLLIADDVGLGKTVQAGLVLAEMIRAERSIRALIIVPSALRDQWIAELDERFRVTCTRADRWAIDDAARRGAFGENPWSQSGVWIASPDYLKQTHVIDSLPLDPWDVIVIDEAHTVCGDSERYALCQRVARRSRRVVLLTATPHAGDAARFQRLLDLGRAGTRDEITIFRRTRDEVGLGQPRRVRWCRIRLSESETRVFDALRAFERAVAARGISDQTMLLLSIFRKRALSTMSALSISIVRRLAWLGEPGCIDLPDRAQPRLSFGDDLEAEDADEHEGLMAQTGLTSQQERSWLRRIRSLADEAARVESKVDRVARLVHRVSEPAVIFTEYRDSLDVVRRRLSFTRQVATLHGGLDAAERRNQLRLFLEGHASLLLATDVAGQGLNLQARTRWVISLELPWNPARLEQRIGRVDRISQTRPTHLSLIVAKDEAESGMLAHLARRVLSARRAIGGSTLEGIAPPESEVRSAVILNRPPGESHGDLTHAHRGSTRWIRPALVAAQMLIHRRAAAAVGRTNAGSSGRTLVAQGGAAVRAVDGPRGTLLVYSVPALTTEETLVTRFSVCLRAEMPLAHQKLLTRPALIAALRPIILRSLRRHLARTRSRLRGIAASQLVRERSVAAVVLDEDLPIEAQPGLFDLRDLNAFVQLSDEQRRVQSAMRTRMHSLEQAGDIRLGEPLLELVISTPHSSGRLT